jgi:hypothetical protein
VYQAHYLTCVWTGLNVCRDGLYDMLCVVMVGRILSMCDEHRCTLLRLDTLVKRRQVLCLFSIF